jgi:hypothetical protein
MSQENVETARRACAAFLARDIDEWVGYHDPEVVFETLSRRWKGLTVGTRACDSGRRDCWLPFPTGPCRSWRYAALVAECSFTSPQVEKVQVVGPA